MVIDQYNTPTLSAEIYKYIKYINKMKNKIYK